jgi:hypothetical protein
VEIIYQQMLPGTPLSAELPDWVKLNIADCIVVFGRLEQTVIEIAWEVAGTTEIKERLKRARQPANNNFDEVLGIVEEVAGTKFDALRTAFDGLSKDRNLIAHGSWLMAGDKPYVAWHKFLIDNDSVMGEFFEDHRFNHFKRRAEKLLETCRKLFLMLTEASGRERSGQ